MRLCTDISRVFLLAVDLYFVVTVVAVIRRLEMAQMRRMDLLMCVVIRNP